MGNSSTSSNDSSNSSSNSSSNNNNNNNNTPQTNYDPIDDSEFEPIDKPASPTFMNVSLGSSGNSANDLAASGVLVDLSLDGSSGGGGGGRSVEEQQQKDALLASRRIVKANAKQASKGPVILSSETIPDVPAVTGSGTSSHHQHQHQQRSVSKTQETDEELLQESLAQDRQQRLQKLQQGQKSKRNKAMEERRNSNKGKSSTSGAQANPFSRFLSAFSVESKYPSHKRAYEPSASEIDGIGGSGEETGSSKGSGSISGIAHDKRLKLNDSSPLPDEDNDDDDDDDKHSNHNNKGGPLAAVAAAASVWDWLNETLPGGAWMAVATATVTATVVAAWRSSSRHSPAR